MSDSKNDIAWQKLFDKFEIIKNVLANDQIVITSNDINIFRESRLMTKFDHKSQLPEIFSENSLSILPISRGSYLIANIDIFHSFTQEEIEIKKIAFPGYLESLDYNNITSEATAINCAFVSGILKDFTNEIELSPTVSGRMSSSCFDFTINSGKGLLKINVENSQVEIDGGYEGATSLNIIEAKNYLSDDFLIRQLYYPYKLWMGKVKKKVRTIFLTYTNGIFHLREYSFEDPGYYNSIKLVRQRKYSVKESEINIETIQEMLSQLKIVDEPKIAFPQADSFERVINLCELLKQKTTLTKDEITFNYDFEGRQTNYYTDAARYLGLVDKKNEDRQVVFFLTIKGREVFNLPIVDRQIEFIKIVLSHSVFKKVIELYFENADAPSRDKIVEIMKDASLYNMRSNTTFYRRASTILGWINWIMSLLKE